MIFQYVFVFFLATPGPAGGGARPGPLLKGCRLARLSGSAVRLDDVRLTGLPGDLARGVDAALAGLRGRWRWSAPCRKQLTRTLTRTARQALADEGYWQAEVNAILSRAGAAVIAHVSVAKMGRRTLAGALDVSNVSRSTRLALLRRVKVRSGKVVRARVLRADAVSITRFFQDRGHVFAKTRVVTRRHSGGRYVDVTFVPSTGPRYKVRAIRVQGASSTGRALVQRALSHVRRKVYNHGRILEGVARLTRTGAFKSVTFKSLKAGRGWVTVVVQVRERPLR
jgi:hypothetical protein